jgi:uncharacterized protein (DUF983 family)
VSESANEEFGAGGPGVSVFRAALGAKCPRCGKGPLFKGFLAVAPACRVCGLDFGPVDTGDGPAVFVILISGFLLVGAALITEVLYAPPYWVHLVIWLPLTLIVTLGLLRPVKALLVALQYKHKAAEGRLVQ